MGRYELKKKLKTALLAIGAYVVISLITHVGLGNLGIHSLGAAFVLTAAWMGGLGWLIWKDMR